MPFLVLRAIRVLKIAVDVGLVVGITAAIRPIGSAIFFIPYAATPAAPATPAAIPTVFKILFPLLTLGVFWCNNKHLN